MGPSCPMLGRGSEETSHLVSVGCQEMRLWQLTCTEDQAVSEGGEEPPPRTSIGTGSMGGPVPVSGGVRPPAWGRVTPPLIFPLSFSAIHLGRRIPESFRIDSPHPSRAGLSPQTQDTSVAFG